MENFGARLKHLRKIHNLTQPQLAEKLHLDKSTIAKYETNKISPSVETVITFAKFFDVTTDYLLGLTNY